MVASNDIFLFGILIGRESSRVKVVEKTLIILQLLCGTSVAQEEMYKVKKILLF